MKRRLLPDSLEPGVGSPCCALQLIGKRSGIGRGKQRRVAKECDVVSATCKNQQKEESSPDGKATVHLRRAGPPLEVANNATAQPPAKSAIVTAMLAAAIFAT